MAPRSRGLRLASPYAYVGPTTPRSQGPRFGLYPFRSPLLGASRLISLSSGYLDVSVPRVSSPCGVTAISDGRVSPFGHLGINACVPLPQAYRSLPRPSSPSCAQASPTCFRSLDHKSVKQSTRDLQRVILSFSYGVRPAVTPMSIRRNVQSLVLIRFPRSYPYPLSNSGSCAAPPEGAAARQL